jgi:hypothetical protein
VTHDPGDAAAAGGPVIEIAIAADAGQDSHAIATPEPAAVLLHRRP